MRIEFDPTNPTEAAAVRAMLTALGPTEVRLTPPEGAVFLADQFIVLNDSEEKPVSGRTQPEPGSTIKVDGDVGFVVPTPETDSTGTPWDERIHSTPATTNKDGTWRAKRGVTAEQVAAVRAEREATPPVALADDPRVLEASGVHPDDVDHPAFTSAPPAPTAPPAPPAPTGQSEAPLAPVETPTAPAETAPTPPSAPVVPSSPSFLDVMKAITAAQKDGKIDTAKVKELCAAVGAGESTMGLNGPDNGDKRVAFMALLAEETK